MVRHRPIIELSFPNDTSRLLSNQSCPYADQTGHNWSQDSVWANGRAGVRRPGIPTRMRSRRVLTCRDDALGDVRHVFGEDNRHPVLEVPVDVAVEHPRSRVVSLGRE